MLPGELQGAIEDALRSCWEDSGDAKVRVWGGHARTLDPNQELSSLAILGVTRRKLLDRQCSRLLCPQSQVNAEMAEGVQLLDDQKVDEALQIFTGAAHLRGSRG